MCFSHLCLFCSVKSVIPAVSAPFLLSFRVVLPIFLQIEKRRMFTGSDLLMSYCLKIA